MGTPEEARWWSWRRQRLDRTARSVDDALRSVLAVTGTNPSAPLSLLARVPRMTTGMYEGAIKARVALRLPAMRHAVWLLPAETAHIAFNALRGGGSSESTTLRRAGVGPEHWNLLREQVLDACKQPVSARDIKAAVEEVSEKVGAVLNVLVATGEVLRVSAPTPFSNAFSFASTSSWLGATLTSMPRDDALTFLAGDYLQAYGPVTIDDFAWWTGLPRNRCEAAILSHEPVSVGDGYLMWPGHVRAFEQSRPVANRVSLLPALDPYPMGYADRSRLGSADALAAASDASGNSLPIVLVEGRIAGLWDFTLDRTQNCTITIRLFDDAGARLWEAVEAEANAVAYMFLARSVEIVRARMSSPSRAAANMSRGAATTRANAGSAAVPVSVVAGGRARPRRARSKPVKRPSASGPTKRAATKTAGRKSPKKAAAAKRTAAAVKKKTTKSSGARGAAKKVAAKSPVAKKKTAATRAVPKRTPPRTTSKRPTASKSRRRPGSTTKRS